jgi:hypothetical protein
LISIYVKILVLFAIWQYIQIIQIPFPNNFNDPFGELELQDDFFGVNVAITVLTVVLKLYNTESSSHRHSDVLRDKATSSYYSFI